MIKDISMTAARHELTSLPERLAEQPGAVAVTRRGKPVLAILPWELYESLVETLEILGDDALMDALRQGVQEVQDGHGVAWEDAKRALDL